MSCTKSLGFESSDERRVDDDDEIELCCSANKVIKWRKISEKREVKRFPPLISSLDHNVHPCFFLRPVRKDGRLELRAVRIDRPEIFRAHREGGRLRLHLEMKTLILMKKLDFKIKNMNCRKKQKKKYGRKMKKRQVGSGGFR
ncbi:hypothetical protein P3X46_035172 [Hevea brasiliensis]|uniref:FAF domain-containing protein n=1 Tax=Hevea brasiliensis TaxID=3981 RepID=A0ABQ9KCG1_HEVBR|nr:hypothetical protein P3X46_035172 [Hevea brasiliensis]